MARCAALLMLTLVALVAGCTHESASPWYEGPHGFIIERPFEYTTPIPYRGKLGFFDVVLP